jgi:TolA-binding protein
MAKDKPGMRGLGGMTRKAEEKAAIKATTPGADKGAAGKPLDLSRRDHDDELQFATPPPPVATTAPPAMKKEAEYAKPAKTKAAATPAPSPPKAAKPVSEGVSAGALADEAEEPMMLSQEADLVVEDERAEKVSRSRSKRSVAKKARVKQKLDYYQTAEQHLADKSYKKALSAYRSFLSRNPHDRRAKTCRYRIAKTLFLMGRCKEAIGAIKQAISKAARHGMAPSALLDQASCHIRLNQFDQARKVYRQIEQKYPAYEQDARRGLKRIQGR